MNWDWDWVIALLLGTSVVDHIRLVAVVVNLILFLATSARETCLRWSRKKGIILYPRPIAVHIMAITITPVVMVVVQRTTGNG